jgi:hypothetical protein
MNERRIRARRRHGAASAALVAVALLASRDGRAEASEPHRLRVEVSPWSVGSYGIPQSDGHYSQGGAWAGEARVAYGYRVGQNFEVGGFTSATVVEEGRLKFFRLQGVARGVLPIGQDFELGGHLRAGIGVATLFEWSYIGPAVAAGFDAEMKLVDSVALVLGVDLAVGIGTPSGVPSDSRGDYFRDASLLMGTILPYTGASVKF